MTITDYITNFYRALIAKCIAFTNKKNWELKLALFLPLVILFFSFPPYYRLVPEYYGCWEAILRQIDAPFVNHHYPPDYHEAKMQFRLTVPIIAKALNLGVVGILLLQALLGIVTLFMATKIFSTILKDNVNAFILTLSFAFIWAGKSAFIEYRGLLDGYAYFFLIAAVYFRHPFIIFLTISLAAWTDERGLIASSLVALYWVWNDDKLKWLNAKTIAIGLSWICYFLVRFLLSKHYGLTTESDGANLSVFKHQFANFAISTWSALEGFWLLITLALLALFKENKMMYIYLMCFATVIIIVVSMSVGDITRSMAYLFPVIFIAVQILQKQFSQEQFRKLSVIILILCFIYPAYESHGSESLSLFHSLPIELLKYLI